MKRSELQAAEGILTGVEHCKQLKIFILFFFLKKDSKLKGLCRNPRIHWTVSCVKQVNMSPFIRIKKGRLCQLPRTVRLRNFLSPQCLLWHYDMNLGIMIWTASNCGFSITFINETISKLNRVREYFCEYDLSNNLQIVRSIFFPTVAALNYESINSSSFQDFFFLFEHVISSY